MHAGALLALGDDCPVGIKVLIEGQEECGDGGIEEFVKANAELLKADVIVISDVGNYALGVPTLTTSLRGMAASTSRSRRSKAPCTAACSAARRPTRSSRSAA